MVYIENMLLEISEKIEASRINERSAEWAELDQKATFGFEKSNDSSSIHSQLAKAKKQKLSFINQVEPYQKESRQLMKNLVDRSSVMNLEKTRLVEEYVSTLESFDRAFTSIKKQGTEDITGQLTNTIVKSVGAEGEFGRRLIALESEIIERERLLEIRKDEMRQGVKLTMKMEDSATRKNEIEKRETREEAWRMTT